MFIIYAVILGILLGLICGGNLKFLVQRPLYWKLLAICAFLIQIVIFSDIPFAKSLSGNVITILHIISYIFLLAFWIRNIKVPGIPVIGAGIFSNSLVIILNGGYMPTFSKNLENTSVSNAAEAISRGDAVHNSIETTRSTLLPWLGDIFYMPSWVPFSNVFSIGDILIAAGICIYLVVNMKQN